MPVDEHAGLIAERTAMYEMLKTLVDGDWDRPSLCAGWRVRDVASHVHLALTINLLRLVAGIAVNRGDFNRFMATHAPQHGNRPPSEILASWKDFAPSSKIPPTTKRVDLGLDVFVHHHDVAIPLGREVPTDPQRLRWLADGMVAASSPILSGPRVQGIRMIASDIEWHHGTGPEVTGPAVALILAGCGRTALYDQLDGAGLEELARRS